jgi:hypothetical protein
MKRKESWLAGSPRRPEEHSGERDGEGVCDARGCVGPFTNQRYYEASGVEMAFGDCMECGRRVALPPSERTFESLGRFVEAILPPLPPGS